MRWMKQPVGVKFKWLRVEFYSNPIMRQDDPDALIQRCGHGDLVETQDGRWYMVYLCGRKIGDGYSILGRETALDPVTWTADGWPIVNGLRGPSCMQIKPFPEKDMYESCSALQSADPLAKAHNDRAISPCGLPFDYMTTRSFNKGDIKYICDDPANSDWKSLKDGQTFVIHASAYPLSDINSRNIVLRRQTDFSFDYSVIMDIPELMDEQFAGITGYYDENTFFEE